VFALSERSVYDDADGLRDHTSIPSLQVSSILRESQIQVYQ